MNKKIDIQKILDLHEKWLNDEKGGVRANLTYEDLTHADLSYANLKNATLSNANLTFANLVRSNLDGAILDGATLDEANLFQSKLKNTSLCNANLRGTNFKFAYLKNAMLTGAILAGADIRYADLTGADLRNTCLSELIFNKFTKIDFKIASIQGSRDNLILMKNEEDVYTLYFGREKYFLEEWKTRCISICRGCGDYKYTNKQIEEYREHVLCLEKAIDNSHKNVNIYNR